jgi:beta-phosphoglucomutase
MEHQAAVIFDMDGVLVDTYHAHYRSWLSMAEPEGLTFSEAQFAPTFGRTSREIIGTFWGAGRFSAEEIAALDDKKEAAFRAIIAQDFPAMPGARELLRRLRQAGFVLAVGSSAPPANVDVVLEKLGVRSLFGAIVTGSDVTRGKPDPQVFLLAAQRLGIPPARCAVVEDAPPGIAAAKAAGMAAVGLTSTGRTRESLAQADLIVGTLAELSPERFRSLIAGESLYGA